MDILWILGGLAGTLVGMALIVLVFGGIMAIGKLIFDGLLALAELAIIGANRLRSRFTS